MLLSVALLALWGIRAARPMAAVGLLFCGFECRRPGLRGGGLLGSSFCVFPVGLAHAPNSTRIRLLAMARCCRRCPCGRRMTRHGPVGGVLPTTCFRASGDLSLADDSAPTIALWSMTHRTWRLQASILRETSKRIFASARRPKAYPTNAQRAE